ncbi:MAG: glycosyltransferase family 39 protein [Proteobacteria bacterium]|nr:glycosyltransferase family 39 protein [Pseudomonadota bacterium]
MSSILSYAVFENVPHVQDEIAQFMQAKIFARGSLTAPAPVIPEFFQYFLDNMIMTNRWYSQYPSGHPVLLMVGVLLGIPWIINPLFASLSVPLLYLFARDYYGEQEARLSAVLYCISPFVLFMSSSFMNHVTTVFFLILFLYSANKTIRNRNTIYAVLAGCALGAMGNIRVGDAFAVGMVFGTLFFIYAIRGKMYREWIMFAVALSCMVGILLLYNYATNGDPLLFGYQVRWGKEHTIGFYDKSLLDNKPVFTPLRGIIHTLSNCIALNQNLLEWPFPSLLPIIIYFIPFLFKKTINDYLLLGGALAAPVFYFFYFYQDLCLGPRFYYASVPFVMILTARSVFEIINSIAWLHQTTDRYVKNAFIMLFVICSLFCACIRIPHLYGFYSNTFWDVDNKLMNKVQEMGIKQAVIFQESYGYRGDGLGSGFLHNSPWLDGSVVFARDLGERNAELIPFFPGRGYYRATRDKQGIITIDKLTLKSSAK